MAIRLEILTIERKLFDETVDMVVVPGIEGVFGILPNHVPLLTGLDYGELQIKRSGEDDEFFAIGGGLIEVRPTHITVLADTAERADEIDMNRADEARRRAEETLANQGDAQDFEKAQAALKRSAARLKIAERRGRRRERIHH